MIDELALGTLRQRAMVLSPLQALPPSIITDDGEVLHYIDRQTFFGLGIGYVDAHLLAALRA